VTYAFNRPIGWMSATGGLPCSTRRIDLLPGGAMKMPHMSRRSALGCVLTSSNSRAGLHASEGAEVRSGVTIGAVGAGVVAH